VELHIRDVHSRNYRHDDLLQHRRDIFTPRRGAQQWRRQQPLDVVFPNGTKVTGNNGPKRVTDRNGNYIEFQHITYNSNPTDKIVDQFGRYILIEHASAADYIHQIGVNNTDLVTTITGTTITAIPRYYRHQSDRAFLQPILPPSIYQ